MTAKEKKSKKPVTLEATTEKRIATQKCDRWEGKEAVVLEPRKPEGKSKPGRVNVKKEEVIRAVKRKFGASIPRVINNHDKENRMYYYTSIKGDACQMDEREMPPALVKKYHAVNNTHCKSDQFKSQAI